MTPQEIQAELKNHKVTQKDIALKVERSAMMVHYVVHKQRVSMHIMCAVAKAIGKPVESVFPEYFESRDQRQATG